MINKIQFEYNKNNNLTDSEYISIKEFIGKNAFRPLKIDILNLKIKNFSKSKITKKKNGIITSFSANSHEGIFRNYNEDKLNIILNIKKPKNYNSNLKGKWPKVSFFSIFDGHNGEKCAEFLKENLHLFIINDDNFPNNIFDAIKNGFKKAENEFFKKYNLLHYFNNENNENNENNNENNNKENNIKIEDLNIEKSGSCVLLTIIIDSKIYIANLGDSRIIMSEKNGKKITQITNDHKPNEINEKKRILKNGGKIYQSKIPIINEKKENKIIIGPYRIIPSKLSVSRTIGDFEYKNNKFGGNNKIIISEPDIFVFDIKNNDIDFLILGCDGIFDLLNNKDIIKSVWNIFHFFSNQNIHFKSGKAVDFILKSAMARNTFDNVSCILICFKDFDDLNIENIDKNFINGLNKDKNINQENFDNYNENDYVINDIDNCDNCNNDIYIEENDSDNNENSFMNENDIEEKDNNEIVNFRNNDIRNNDLNNINEDNINVKEENYNFENLKDNIHN